MVDNFQKSADNFNFADIFADINLEISEKKLIFAA